MGAATLAAFLGEIADSLTIVAILFLNALVGFLQERRAADALAALRKMTAPHARVKREGQIVVIPAANLVPGDLVLLEAGDPVPADLRLVHTSALRTEEAALTGESEPVDKNSATVLDGSTPLAGRANMAYLGTLVAAGMGTGWVVATGTRTEFGKIAELVRATEEDETPLQTRLRSFGKTLVGATGVIIVLVFLLGLLRNVPLLEMALTSVSLAVAAVPEGLPAVVTIALALGVHRMARKGTLIRRLSSVETLGCTTVICSDKTGTLTVGRMTVRRVETLEGGIEIDEVARMEVPDPVYRVLWASAACCTARLVERDGSVQLAGDPTEGAILLASRKAGITAEVIDAREPLISIRPFDAERKRMSCVRKAGDKDRSYVKGAPEVILPRCASLQEEGTRNRALRRMDEMAGEGLRVLAVAVRDVSAGEDPEDRLVFLGLVGLQDPPRPEAKNAVATCRRAGIRPVMITGDNPRTALAVARALGIAEKEEEVLTGPALGSMDDDTLARRVEQISVYARVDPEHKLRIVRAWKARGAVVAMTGDGVNDAPALKGADIGIAMGKTGTEVAKDASAMVITDDNFASIVSAVEEGRAIFENIRKTLLYLLSGNTAELLIMGIAVIAGWPLPLMPIQLLWVNLVTDGLPALALVTDPSDRDLLRQRPRPPGQEIVDRNFISWMLIGGLLIALSTLAGFLYGLEIEHSLEKARAYAFSTLVMGEVLRAFASRSRTRILWEIGLGSNMRLVVIAVLTLGLQIYSHHSGILEGFLKTGALTFGECMGSLALAVVPVTVLEVWKLARRLFIETT